MAYDEWSENKLLHRLTLPKELPAIEGWNIFRGIACVPSESMLRLVWAYESCSLLIVVEPDQLAPPTFVVRYDEVAQFTVTLASREILISPLSVAVADSIIEHLLVDQIWPRILAHEGQLVLHAAGVTSSRGAILFLGESGRGKSTLAASLDQCGFPLLGDDSIVTSTIDGEARCKAVYRSLRLFPDSIDTLFEQPVSRTEIGNYTDKENIHLPAAEHRDGDHGIRAIFSISPDDSVASASVELVPPGDACMRLVEHSFWLDPTDTGLTARKLQSASLIANGVRLYQLAYPRDYAKLAEVHAAIFKVLD